MVTVKVHFSINSWEIAIFCTWKNLQIITKPLSNGPVKNSGDICLRLLWSITSWQIFFHYQYDNLTNAFLICLIIKLSWSNNSFLWPDNLCIPYNSFLLQTLWITVRTIKNLTYFTFKFSFSVEPHSSYFYCRQFTLMRHFTNNNKFKESDTIQNFCILSFL